MDDRPFVFLACLGCRYFFPKRGYPLPAREIGNPSFVGFCTAGEEARWIVWRSLEYAACRAGRCSDREPGLFPQPRCRFFEATTESAVRTYPDSCVYFRTPLCPLDAPALGREGA
jgi:hypothetical protein